MEDEEQINYIKLFYNKLRTLGYSKKIKYFDQFQIYSNDKYNNFFDIITSYISESNLLSNSESILEERKDDDYFIEEFELKEQILQMEISRLESELMNVDKELTKTSKLCEIEEIDNIKYSKINGGLSKRVGEKDQEYKDLCSNYQESVLNTLLSKCINLNKVCMRFIYELDSNSKNIGMNDFQIVNKKKLNNLTFNEIILDLEQLLINVEKIFNLYKSKKESENTMLESLLKNEGVFSNQIEELKKVIDLEKIVLKNEELLKYNLKKEEIKCSMLRDILTKKNNSSLISNTKIAGEKVYDLCTLMKNYLDLNLHQIEKENKFQIHSIFNEHNKMITQVINSEGNEFSLILSNIKEMVYGLIPLIEKDQLFTQEIYENIVDIVDKYTKYYVDLTSSQYSLKLKLNETNILNKITIDDRDSFNIHMCKVLSNVNDNSIEKNQLDERYRQDFIRKEIYDFNFLIDNFNVVFKNVTLTDKFIYNKLNEFNEEIFSKIKSILKIFNKINKKKELLQGNDYICKKKSLDHDCKIFKESNKDIFTYFFELIKENLYYRSDNSLNIVDIIYLYLFNQKQLTNIFKYK